MRSYFITARSKAAPFCSDDDERWWMAESPHDALAEYVGEYDHPAGLWAAEVWRDANAMHTSGVMPLARWQCYELQEREAGSKRHHLGGGSIV